MFISTPPSAGPDEPTHEVTAWYLSGHGLRPGSIEWFSVPVSFSVDPCFIHASQVTAGCMPPRSTAQALASTAEFTNYGPPYYWVVGVGQRIAASLLGIEYADIGGRLASFILNFGALLVLSLYMRRRSQWWGTFLLLVSTPMAVSWGRRQPERLGDHLRPGNGGRPCPRPFGVVNRSGPTPGPGHHRDARRREHRPVSGQAARVIWASGLTVSAIALAPSVNRRLLLRVASAVAPGIVLGILWTLAFPTLLPSDVAANRQLSQRGRRVWPFPPAISLRVWQMFGDLGWLDTPPPVPLSGDDRGVGRTADPAAIDREGGEVVWPYSES